MSEAPTSKERLGPLSDVEQALLYEFCWSNPVAYSLVRRLCAHGLAPVAPLPEELPAETGVKSPPWKDPCCYEYPNCKHVREARALTHSS